MVHKHKTPGNVGLLFHGLGGIIDGKGERRSMVRLYTSGKYFKDNEIIIDNDSFFNNNVSAKSLSENSIKVMEEVDHAKLLDQNIGKIETPYGITVCT